MKRFKQSFVLIIWLVIVLLISNASIISTVLGGGKDKESEVVQEDSYMTTNRYDTFVQVHEDNTYSIEEQIDVSYLVPRHGIYRYVPYKGTIVTGIEDGTIEKIPYRAFVDLKDANTTVSEYSENNNEVFRFGDEDSVVSQGEYQFTYEVRPVTQEGYTNVYYNVFPTGWQNQIPAGSQFTVGFPKEFDHDILKLYYGSFGEMKDAKEIVDLVWDGNILTGTLRENLPVGNGITFYAPMEEGYFIDVPTASGIPWLLIGLSAICLTLVGILFFSFGRDEKIYPSIQYYPPDGLDSAAVGYIVDGSVEDKDIVSLLVYWADKGYLAIEEEKKNKITFIKRKDLDSDAPEYARIIFDGIFGKNAKADKRVKLSSLKYSFVSKMNESKKELKKDLDKRGDGGIYTRASRAARIFAGILSLLPFAGFILVTGMYTSGTGVYIWSGVFMLLYIISLIFLCHTVDIWYARSSATQRSAVVIGMIICVIGLAGFSGSYLVRVFNGTTFRFIITLIIMVISSLCMLPMTIFMKKRTHQCVTWMGSIIGLRDFIQTAELERMQFLANENPKWFYHIMPYAYVFGLSDVWMKKFEQISIPAPDWYYNTTGRMDVFDFYIFHHCMMHNLRQVSTTFSTPKPQEASSSGGGGFSGGGGGFSGGGFGGGGGGSW